MRKIVSITITITMIISCVFTAFGGNGDGVADDTFSQWSVNISDSSYVTDDYKIGQEKQFTIEYSYTTNIEVKRYLEITGPAEVTEIQYMSDDIAFVDGNKQDESGWRDIDSFSEPKVINSGKKQRVRATFNEQGVYQLRMWIATTDGVFVTESVKNIYVSDLGIVKMPISPSSISLSGTMLRWQYTSGMTIDYYNIYIDDNKVNEEQVSKSTSRYNLSKELAELDYGTHTVAVTTVRIIGDEHLESDKISVQYVVEEPTTETTTEPITTETTTTESAIEEPLTTTETASDMTTESEVTNESVTEEIPTTTEEIPTTTEEVSATTETASDMTTESVVTEEPISETTTEEVPATTEEIPATTETVSDIAAESTTESNVTTKDPDLDIATEVTIANQESTEKNIKLGKPVVKYAYKKHGSKKIKVRIIKVKKAKSYQVQICKNRKFNKKSTITKKYKKIKFTIKIRKRSRKYFIRVRAMVRRNGKIVCGNWSDKTRVKIKF